MSKKVIIYAGADTTEELVDLLQLIATQIDNGATSGHYPGWEIVEDEDNE